MKLISSKSLNFAANYFAAIKRRLTVRQNLKLRESISEIQTESFISPLSKLKEELRLECISLAIALTTTQES